MDCFIGEIRMWTCARVPQDWHLCDGSLLKVSDYQALYSLIGTTYGGDGINTFGLPDLRGRVPIGQGQGNGLTTRVLGQKGGGESVAISIAQMPGHTHTVAAAATVGTTNVPDSTVVWANTGTGPKAYSADTSASLAAMGTEALSQVGGSQAHNNVMPSLVVNFIIALQGTYPTRD